MTNRTDRLALALFGAAWLGMAAALATGDWSSPGYTTTFAIVGPDVQTYLFGAVGLAAIGGLWIDRSARWVWTAIAAMAAWWAGSFAWAWATIPQAGPSAAIIWLLVACLAVVWSQP